MIVPAELEEAVQGTAESVLAALGGADKGPKPETCRVAAEAAWGMVYGICRGRVPNPVPFDLSSVALSLAVRQAVVLDISDNVNISPGGRPDPADPQYRPSPVQSLSVGEWMIINRYRRRSA